MEKNSGFIGRRHFLGGLLASGVMTLADFGILADDGSQVAPSLTAPLGFRDVTAASGIRFRHDRAASSQKLLPEIMGAGCAWIDYDADGLLDAFFVNSGRTPLYKPAAMCQPALYRNNGDGTFTDVTLEAGLHVTSGFYCGVAVGDFDNDGFPDIFITGYDGCLLFQNNGQGGFVNVTQRAGLSHKGGWATAAGWFDYDHDGRLDLLVGNYVRYDWNADPVCGRREPGYRTYCDPYRFQPSSLCLYHNNGDGTFTDRSREAGLSQTAVKCLGMVLADFTGNGWDDILIANDGMPTNLFLNAGTGSFRDVTFECGAGYGPNGEIESGMGIDAADVSSSGRLDFYIGHMDAQLNRFYRNEGAASFTDETFESGLARTNWSRTTFGVSFLDWDNDGAKDLLAVNGSMLDNISLYHPGSNFEERKTLYRNLGGGRFADVTDTQDESFRVASVGRGLAVGDFNNDGAVDFIESSNGGAAQLFRNQGDPQNSWLIVVLEGVKSNRDAVGAQVRLKAGDLLSSDQIKGGTSYCSSQDKRLHFGLGRRSMVNAIEVRWPSGHVDVLRNVPAKQIIKIVEGRGIVPASYRKF